MLDVRLLGPSTLTVGRQPVTIRSARTRKLLALMALNANTVVPVDQLVDVLWDVPPASARQQVHNVIAALRQCIAVRGLPAAIETSGSGYRLEIAASAVDVLRFKALIQASDRYRLEGRTGEAVESLERALAEWSGQALYGLGSAHLANVATALDEQRLVAVESLALLRIQQGDCAASVSELMEFVADNPFRESLRATLMKALFHGGRRADALTVFQDGRRLLREELGLEPGSQLQAAQRLILGADAAADPGSRCSECGQRLRSSPSMAHERGA